MISLNKFKIKSAGIKIFDQVKPKKSLTEERYVRLFSINNDRLKYQDTIPVASGKLFKARRAGFLMPDCTIFPGSVLLNGFSLLFQTLS